MVIPKKRFLGVAWIFHLCICSFPSQVSSTVAHLWPISLVLHFDFMSPNIDYIQKQLGFSWHTGETILITYLWEYSSAQLALCRTSKKSGIRHLHEVPALCWNTHSWPQCIILLPSNCILMTGHVVWVLLSSRSHLLQELPPEKSTSLTFPLETKQRKLAVW